MQFTFEPGRLFYEQDGQVLAEILFPAIDNGRVWSINHTYVNPALRGQGVAGQMLAEVVERAQQAGVQLKPVCSYAREAFLRHPDYQALERRDV
ncbi:GNAT family N-acetyltransferase [Weissella halotolerans]|nr:GNAT family N-acetyltransferase [Weissella halotolerans]